MTMKMNKKYRSALKAVGVIKNNKKIIYGTYR